MKAFWNIIQGTEEWHRIRYGKIGGSSSAGLLTDSDTLLDQLGAEHMEPFVLNDDSYMSYDMLRGCELEPMGRERLCEYKKIEFLECGWLQSESIPLIGISPDGINKNLTASIELKCPSAKKHFSTLRGKLIPKDNIYQCLHYFTVNEALEQHTFGSFRPECEVPLFAKTIDLDSMIELTVNRKKETEKVSKWVERLRHAAQELEERLKITLEQINGI